MLSSWSLKKLFLAASFVISAMIVAVMVTVQIKLNQIVHVSEKDAVASQVAMLALNARYHIVQIQQFLTDASLTGDKEGVDEAQKNLEELKAVAAKISQNFPNLASQADDIIQKATDLETTGIEMYKAYLEKGKVVGNEIMQRPETGLDARAEAIDAATTKLLDTVMGVKKDYDDHLMQEEYSMRLFTQVLSAISMLIVLLGQLMIYRRISPVNGMIQSIQKQAKNVHESSNTIKFTTGELSAATTEQAAAIQETVASSEEMASMLSQTAQHSGRSMQISEEGKDKSEKGLVVMERLGNAMDEIQKTNEKLEGLVRLIEDIKSKTKVINDIVFETRLLSFNASIEAARAGVHGKGFAVVAEEVGKLATMSGKAADEIRTLLDSSTSEVGQVVRSTQDKVTVGKQVSEECQTVFQEMGSILGRIIESVTKITTATKEQEIGIKQTNRAMSEMDKVSNSNSQTADKLTGQTEKLFDASNSLEATILDLQHVIFGYEFSVDSTNYRESESRGQNEQLKSSKPTHSKGNSKVSRPVEVVSTEQENAVSSTVSEPEVMSKIDPEESPMEVRKSFKWKKSS